MVSGTDGREIRLAEPDDIEPTVRTLVRAFEDYPMTRLGLSQDGYLDRLARYHRLFLTEIGLPYGQIWITEDHSAVAVWTTPKTPPDVFRPLAEQFREIAGDRAGPAAEYEQAMALFRPRTPVWFLGVLGVDPSHQRARGSAGP